MWKRMGYGLLAIVTLLLAALGLVGGFAWLSGDIFVDLVVMGFVGFVFARLVVLLLVAFSLRRMWRSFPRFTASITSLGLLSLGAFAVMKSYSPEGTYGFVGETEPMNNAPDLVPELYHKDHIWRFSNGHVYDCYGDSCDRYGRYEKTADGWIVITEAKEPYTWKLQFSVFGFRLIHVEREGATAFCPRRIIPFARPYWMPDWFQ